MSETTQRKRTVVWENPTVDARAAEQMSGLEFLGAMQKEELPLPPICELVGFEPAEVEEGRGALATPPPTLVTVPLQLPWPCGAFYPAASPRRGTAGPTQCRKQGKK